VAAPVFIADSGVLDARPERLVLSGNEGRHAVSVVRLSPGEHVDVVDGAGLRAHAVVVAARKPDVLEVEIRAYDVDPEPHPRITVIQALPKSDRSERTIEVLTEVGVDRIVPWSASRCVTQWKDSKGRDKWVATARESAKQSRRSRFPEIGALASTKALLQLIAESSCVLVLHESGSVALADIDIPQVGDIALVVGPEGGISPEELEAMVAAGGVPTRMGPTVLRTSTAGAVAAGVVLSRSGRWQDLTP
jgi:16S rRNA (uracil1498-N3)-methyltransferase